MDMDVLFQEYEQRLVRRQRSPHTLKAFRQAARIFTAYLRDEHGTDASAAEPWMVEDFFEGSRYAPSTLRTHLSYVRAAYAYALRRGAVTADPTVDVCPPRLPDRRPVIIPNDELREIRDRCWRAGEWKLFHLLAYTGMRRNEVRTLTWEHVDLAGRTITVIGKGGRLRLVPIHPVLGEVLSEAGDVERADAVIASPAGAPFITEVTLANWLRRIAPGRTPHDFRRTVTSSLRRNGVDVEHVDRILGWQPRSVRARYYERVADDQLLAAILRLYADDPI